MRIVQKLILAAITSGGSIHLILHICENVDYYTSPFYFQLNPELIANTILIIKNLETLIFLLVFFDQSRFLSESIT